MSKRRKTRSGNEPRCLLARASAFEMRLAASRATLALVYSLVAACAAAQPPNPKVRRSDRGSASAPLSPAYSDLASPACADVRDESLEHACWRIAPQSGSRFVALSASCGVSDRHEVECWRDELSSVPAGQFDVVDDNGLDACAARHEGGVVCWGAAPWPSVPSAPRFLALVVGGSTRGKTDEDVTACGITIGQDIVCWGNGVPGWSGHLFLPGPFAAIELGAGHLVALTSDGFVKTFGGLPRRDASASTQPRFKAISQDGFNCQVTSDDHVECQGLALPGTSLQPPASLGQVAQIRSGQSHACALKADGVVKCWGDYRPPPDLRFRYISRPAWDSYCGLTVDDRAYCWGTPSRHPRRDLDQRVDGIVSGVNGSPK